VFVSLCAFAECCAAVTCASNSTLCAAGTAAVAGAAGVSCAGGVCAQDACCAAVVPPTPSVPRPAAKALCPLCTRIYFSLATPPPATAALRAALGAEIKREIGEVIGVDSIFMDIDGIWTGAKTNIALSFKPTPTTQTTITSSADAVEAFVAAMVLGKFTDGATRVVSNTDAGITTTTAAAAPAAAKLKMHALNLASLVVQPCLSHLQSTRGDGLCTGNDFATTSPTPTPTPTPTPIVTCLGDEIDISRHQGWWIKITDIAIGVMAGQALLFAVIGAAIALHCKSEKGQYRRDKEKWDDGHDYGRTGGNGRVGPGGRRDAQRRGTFRTL
jgi:hypothetical protein